MRRSALVRPACLQKHVELGQSLGQFGGSPVEGVPTVADPGGPPEGRVGLPADVDGRMGSLNRLGEHLTFVQGVDLALVGGLFVAPERTQDLDVLIGARTAVLPRHLESVEFFFEPTDADPQVNPTRREPVQGGDLFGGVDRIALGEQQHRRAQSHRLRTGRQVGEGHHRFEQARTGRCGDLPVRRIGVPTGVLLEEHDMLANPQRRDAARLGRSPDRFQ